MKMTELDQLSFYAREEYVHEDPEHRLKLRLEHEMCFDDGFRAGFKKAREMAEKEARGSTVAINCDHEDDLTVEEEERRELDIQYNMACWEIFLRLGKLGEKEVAE